MLFSGIDVGSTFTKGIVIDENKSILSKAIVRTNWNLNYVIEELFYKLLNEKKIEPNEINSIASTGIGKKWVKKSSYYVSEVKCYSSAGFHYLHNSGIIIDIGGQDTKIIKIDEKGDVVDFRFNRQCSSGTGSFLEEIARRADITLVQLNNFAEKSSICRPLNSLCTVFAGTEFIQRIANGDSIEDLCHGAIQSVCSRIVELFPIDQNCWLSGGVIAIVPILKDIIEKNLCVKINVLPEPQFTAAFGAALTNIGNMI